MLERETELITQIVVESTINARPSVKLNEVMATSLPRGVKAFMVAETMKLLSEDFKQSANLSRITASMGRTVTTERTLLRSLAMEYIFQREEFLKLVEDTVHFLENYLCRPQWTLQQLVFGHDARVTYERLVTQFDCVVDYSYYKILVERYALRNGLREIHADLFKTLLTRIDQEILKQHSPREIALLTKPIFDFLLFGDESMDRPIPLGAILLFFEDKKLVAIKEYIDRICQIRARSQISLNELVGMIEDLYQVESTVQEEVRESEQSIFAPVATALDSGGETQQAATPEEPATHDLPPSGKSDTTDQGTAPEENPTTMAQDQPGGVQPVTITEQAETLPDSAIEPPPEFAEVQPSAESPSLVQSAQQLLAYALERETLRRMPLLTFPERRSAVEGNGSLPDVDTIITDEQRSAFIKRIFKNDETSYRMFVSSLNATHSWRDAQVFLRELFQLNKLDILSPDVVEFTDAMHSRYEPDLKNYNEVH